MARPHPAIALVTLAVLGLLHHVCAHDTLPPRLEPLMNRRIVRFASPLLSPTASSGPTCPASSNTTCLSTHTCCADAFSNTKFGCCPLGTDAVCCQLPMGGTTRNFCCPAGATCTPQGCSPAPNPPRYACGPVQGENCTEVFVCPPGPQAWTASPERAATTTATAPPAVVVMGDSVSIGWTPQLAAIAGGPVRHSPDSGDGGARSTSNALQCYDYLTTLGGTPATGALQRLPLGPADALVFNFGLHDYNLGMAGVANYSRELSSLVGRLQRDFPATRLRFALTTPAHNVGTDDSTNQVVQALNAAASSVMAAANIPTIDLYTPIMHECGPVPFADSGPHACRLCAPHCKSLAVHYTDVGYQFIAGIVHKALAD